MGKKFIVENLLDLKEPTSISFKKYNIANQERTMDGSLVVDFIASKEMIEVTWDVLNDTDFQDLLLLIEKKQADNGFYSVKYLKPSSENLETITAYTEQVTYYPYFLAGGSVVWRDVSISFVEV